MYRQILIPNKRKNFPEMSPLPNHNGFLYVQAGAAFGFNGILLTHDNILWSFKQP